MSACPWPSTDPGPRPGIAVWDVDLTAAKSPAACLAILSEDERARAGRFLRPEDGHRFAASHAALRLLLGRHLGADPRTLAFGRGPAGKPHLAGIWAGACAFNLSHSGGRALIGISPSAEIGVDVEAMRPMPDALGIARAHFAPREVAALEGLDPPDLAEAFFACWTRKEAIVKATGQGLLLPLDSFAVSVSPGHAALLQGPGGVHGWSLHDLAPAPGHAGAIAIAAAGTACERLGLPPDWPSRLDRP